MLKLTTSLTVFVFILWSKPRMRWIFSGKWRSTSNGTTMSGIEGFHHGPFLTPFWGCIRGFANFFQHSLQTSRLPDAWARLVHLPSTFLMVIRRNPNRRTSFFGEDGMPQMSQVFQLLMPSG